MNLLKFAIGMATLVAFGALSPIVVAAPVVPPGNSAATQYTETFPTSHGAADVNEEIDGSEVRPSKVIGSHKAKKLENEGADGKAVAEITAATAPIQVEPESSAPETKAAPAKSSDESQDHHGDHSSANGGVAGGGGGNSGGSGAGGGVAGKVAPPATDVRVVVESSSGSSGLGQVLEQATGGSSSGQLGLFLPLLIIATVAWSLNYAWRQRQAGS